MTVAVKLCPLPDLGVLAARGAGASAFLQGQLSNDLSRLNAQRSLLAGLHNPQGRALALLRLAQPAPQEILAVLPRELLAMTLERLRKFVLRAKVSLTDESAALEVIGIEGSERERVAARSGLGVAAALSLEGDGTRELALLPAARTAQLAAAANRSRQAWRALDIAAGLPQLYAATSGAFVAQMLNLDLLGGIAFDKGCYTGQEIIARAHYRGRVKRRMQRLLSAQPVALAAGSHGTLSDGRAFAVVEALQRDDGRCEFLAVAALPGLAEPSAQLLQDAHAASPAEALLEYEPLALPYALPE